MPTRQRSVLHCLARDRCAYAPRTRRPTLSQPADAAAFLADHYPPGLTREVFSAVLLDARNRVIRLSVVSVGTLSASLVHPREVFAPAITRRAAAIIVAHNHPSGAVDPSSDDLALTKRLVNAGELLGIEVLDHVILGASGRYHSMKATGSFP